MNAKGLKRAEGEEWFAAMEEDLNALTELHASLEKTHHGIRRDRQHVRQSGEREWRHCCRKIFRF